MRDTLINRIQMLAEIEPEKICIRLKNEQLTYAELYEKIIAIGQILKEKGISVGDCICFSAVSKPQTVCIFLGIQSCGAIAVPIDKKSKPENIFAIYNEVDSKILLTDVQLKEYEMNMNVISAKEIYELAGQMKQIDWKFYCPNENELAQVLFTTGTSGIPKGVMLSYRSVYHILRNTINGIGIKVDDVILLPLPLNHSFAVRVLFAFLYQGATIVLQNGFTFAKEIENNIEKYNCNSLALVPSSLELLKGQMQDKIWEILEKLRYIEFSAGALSIKQRKEVTKFLPNTLIFNTWGSTETGGAIFCNVSEAVNSPDEIGMLGKTIDGIEIQVRNAVKMQIENNTVCVGRLALNGSMKMVGYWKNKELTDAVMADGWVVTSDLVYQDKEGRVFICGRQDDQINVGGEKVFPIEIERVAQGYKGIIECTCIGVEDPEGVLGYVPVLFMVVNNKYSEKELSELFKLKLEKFKIPKYYILIEKIPKNNMQKVDKKLLHEMWKKRDNQELLNPVVRTLLTRRSIRKFTDDVIPEDILRMILKTGFYAPSGHNLQTWRFTVLTKQEDIEELKEKVRIVSEKKRVHFYGFENPKVIIIISNDERNPDGCQDASCAAENMMIAAHSYGIGSVWINALMTLRNEQPISGLLTSFGIPENHIVWAMIALGYPLTEGITLAKKENVVKFV